MAIKDAAGQDVSGNETVAIRQWIRKGSMLYNADALPTSDPDSTYGQILSMGKRPEDYGLISDESAMFDGKSREELIREISSLRAELSYPGPRS